MKIAFDFESWRIEAARQLPPGVCMSWCELTESAAGLAVGSSGVVTAAEGCEYLLRWLEGGHTLVGANTAFDALVSVVTVASQGGDWKRLLKAWVEAYEQGRVRDVFVRQKLLDLAAGCYRFEELPNGVWLTYGYNLRDLSKRLTKRELSKPEAGDTDHWRLRFSELEGVPIEQYPKAAYDYALEDAIATAEDFIAQERLRTDSARIRRNFPGRDPFVDEVRQTMTCVPLKAMSAYGLRTDGPSVERLAAEVQEKIEEARADLVEAGLVRPPAYSRNTDAIIAYLKKHERLGWFWEGDEIKLSKSRYMDAWRETNDVNLWRLANYREISKDPKAYAAHLNGLVADGLVEIEHTRDTKAAQKRCALAYLARGATVPRTDGWRQKTDEEKKSEPYDCVSLDSDACAGSEDPILQVYSNYTSLAKTLANDIPMLRGGVDLPVHTRYEELLETGRTSSSKPNVQNVRRLPGIRECFVPRPGHVFVDCDFGSLELHTLAQTCIWVLGFSKLGEALNAGRDVHLIMAAKMLGIDYDTAKARRAAGDSEVDNARTAGKGANFGRAGGLGIDTFVVYAWTNYRVRLTREKVKELLDLYDQTWVEMPAYFNWIKSHKDPFSVKTIIDEKTKQERETCRYNIIQPWSQRLRAGATFCAACNSPFQGLGADVAKLSLWLVWKATVGLSELGEADPLFGCHPVNFVHDSIMTEVPEERAHTAAVRQKELMDLAGRIVLPDVPVRADMLVCRQWSKKAQRLKNAAGELIPWDLRTACREALDGWRVEHADADSEAAFKYLKEKQWPSDVARDAVQETFGADGVGKAAA